MLVRPPRAPTGLTNRTGLVHFIHSYRNFDLAGLGKEVIHGSFALCCPWRAAPGECTMALAVLLLAARFNRRPGDRSTVVADCDQCCHLLSDIKTGWSAVAARSLLGFFCSPAGDSALDKESSSPVINESYQPANVCSEPRGSYCEFPCQSCIVKSGRSLLDKARSKAVGRSSPVQLSYRRSCHRHS